MLAYRAHVDAAVEALIGAGLPDPARELIVLGLAHEEQHQELILMDILSLFAASPLDPIYSPTAPDPASSGRAAEMIAFDGGIVAIGAGEDHFAFDNERPRHEILLRPYALASKLVTNGEWLAFMADGGYRRPEFWLADGWARVQEEGWGAPPTGEPRRAAGAR